jgi:Acetyl esterase (deacetylase)
MSPRPFARALAFAGALFCSVAHAAPVLKVVPDRPDWTQSPGAPVRFQLSISDEGRPLPGVELAYTLGPDGYPGPERKIVTDASGTAVIDGGTLAEPGFLRCSARLAAPVAGGGKPVRGTAAVGFAPEKIAPVQTEPADFDAFWAAQKAELAKVPAMPELTPLPELSNERYEAFHLALQNVGAWRGPTRVYGILTVPRGTPPAPALLALPGAGVRGYKGFIDYANRGYITLQIGVHGVPVNLPDVVYTDLQAGALIDYPSIGLERRETYYFRRVILGCLRAVDYLATHPRWDGKNLIALGGSQGGMLAIATAALDARVSHVAANYPAFCDVAAPLQGRAGGWPTMFKNDRPGDRTPEKIATTAYYDTVNFARRVRVPGFYMWGHNDEVCPPGATYAAYNLIPGPKTREILPPRGHESVPEFSVPVRTWILKNVPVAR